MNILRLVISVLLLPGGTLAQSPATSSQDFDLEMEAKLVAMINQARSDAKLPALAADDRLRASAREHALFLAANGRPAAQFPGEPSLSVRYAKNHILEDAAGENFSITTDPVASQERLLKGSGRDNILEARFDSVGLAVLRRGKFYFLAQDFAHFITEQPIADVETAVMDTVNKMRSKKNRYPLKPLPDLRLRTSACDMANDDAVSLNHARISTEMSGTASQGEHSGPGRGLVISYATLHADEVPRQVERITNEPDITAISVGACFRKTDRYPEGIYWVTIVAHHRYTEMR